MTPKFLYAIEKTLKHEGGYVHNANDPGGETNWGLSKKSYPKLDIKNITIEEARQIYFRDFWKPIYDKITAVSIAAKVFDVAVNMGHYQAHKLLQQACNQCGASMKVDGIFGEGTLESVNSIEVNRLMREFKTEIIIFYNTLSFNRPKSQIFIKGWIRRAMSD